jgi:hypothetical protein
MRSSPLKKPSAAPPGAAHREFVELGKDPAGVNRGLRTSNLRLNAPRIQVRF